MLASMESSLILVHVSRRRLAAPVILLTSERTVCSTAYHRMLKAASRLRLLFSVCGINPGRGFTSKATRHWQDVRIVCHHSICLTVARALRVHARTFKTPSVAELACAD